MAEAMNMSIEKFKEELNKSTEQRAKKKTDDSINTKNELKKLQKQVKEMRESQMAQREESDSDATEDSGWGSDENPHESHLCELIAKVKELLSVHNSDSADAYENRETSQAEECGFEMTIKADRETSFIIIVGIKTNTRPHNKWR